MYLFTFGLYGKVLYMNDRLISKKSKKKSLHINDIARMFFSFKVRKRKQTIV